MIWLFNLKVILLSIKYLLATKFLYLNKTIIKIQYSYFVWKIITYIFVIGQHNNEDTRLNQENAQQE